MTTPKGSREWRVTRAIQLSYTTDKTQAEIGEELGVSRQKVNEYVNSPPAQEVDEFLAEQQAEVRTALAAELKEDLQRVSEEARTAEEPVEVWRDEQGDVQTVEIRNGNGDLLERKPVPQSHEMGPDSTERFFRREEKREIMEDMRELVGADAPEEFEHNVDMDADHTFDATEGVSAEFVTYSAEEDGEDEDGEDDDGDS